MGEVRTVMSVVPIGTIDDACMSGAQVGKAFFVFNAPS